MDPGLRTRILQIVDTAVSWTERVRMLVEDGDFDGLETALQHRADSITELGAALADAPDHAPDAEVAERIETLRTKDRELTEWMKAQKEEVAKALASLRQQSHDPYAERYVGSVLLSRTT